MLVRIIVRSMMNVKKLRTMSRGPNNYLNKKGKNKNKQYKDNFLEKKKKKKNKNKNKIKNQFSQVQTWRMKLQSKGIVYRLILDFLGFGH